MVDRDLAELYQVDTKVFNQAVKRNIERFPESFRFQLSNNEKDELVTNCDRFKTTIKFAPSNPFVFTEQGVLMLSAVLKSETAIHTSIRIIERPRQKAIRILQDGRDDRHRTALKAVRVSACVRHHDKTMSK
ncbi:MAG: ORF6N domain-containing protein [Lachnospiraceae bacterium]|nr:ORF6N domain-containing protein [Lachnospiraceae bacterium]